MYWRRYWEVSNLIPSLELNQASRKGELYMLIPFQMQIP